MKTAENRADLVPESTHLIIPGIYVIIYNK